MQVAERACQCMEHQPLLADRLPETPEGIIDVALLPVMTQSSLPVGMTVKPDAHILAELPLQDCPRLAVPQDDCAPEDLQAVLIIARLLATILAHLACAALREVRQAHVARKIIQFDTHALYLLSLQQRLKVWYGLH